MEQIVNDIFAEIFEEFEISFLAQIKENGKQNVRAILEEMKEEMIYE